MSFVNLIAWIVSLPTSVVERVLQLLKVLLCFIIMDVLNLHRCCLATILVYIELKFSYFDWDVQRSVKRGLAAVGRIGYHNCTAVMVEILKRTREAQSLDVLEAAAKVFCNITEDKRGFQQIYKELSSFRSEVVFTCCAAKEFSARRWKRAWLTLNDLRKNNAQLLYPTREQPFDRFEQLSQMPEKLRPYDNCMELVQDTLHQIHDFMRGLVAENCRNLHVWDACASILIYLHQSHVDVFPFNSYTDIIGYITALDLPNAGAQQLGRFLGFAT